MPGKRGITLHVVSEGINQARVASRCATPPRCSMRQGFGLLNFLRRFRTQQIRLASRLLACVMRHPRCLCRWDV